MIVRLLYKYLLKAAFLLLLALVLYGVFSGTRLAVILVLFVLARFISLIAEAFRRPFSSAQLETALDNLTRTYEKLPAEKRVRLAAVFKIDTKNLTARDLAQARVNQIASRYVPPRPGRELFAEALGVVAFAILIPLAVAFYSRDFFSLRIGHGWEGALVMAVCICLYLLPHWRWKSQDASELRTWWWVLPFIIGFTAVSFALQARHPYLNPLNPDRNRLAAERVLSLKNNIIAGYHADWVLRYAQQLDQQGQAKQAIHYYQETLRLNANSREAATRLGQLEGQSSTTFGEDHARFAETLAPYWTNENCIVPPPRCAIDSRLENVESCTVVIVPVGDVPDALLNSAGYVVHNELNLPVLICTNAVLLPPHTRVRGLATGPQWSEAAIVKAFTNNIVVFPRAPVKYLLISTADIYMTDDENFVFSTTYVWGGLVSSSRFSLPPANGSLIHHRVAKQSLCALLKSFGIRQSTDRDCVTSYTSNLHEFDVKGNRPDADTMELFQQAVAAINDNWQRYKAMTQTSAK
jgi:predicted Zn-dependent protease